MPTSTLSEVKLRRLVDMMRTSRSNTISSIGRRSYDTRPELMIFCMPVRASPSAGPLSKPSRLSISAWFSSRAGLRRCRPAVSASVSAPQAAASSSSDCSVCSAHWTSIWVNSTSLTLAGHRHIRPHQQFLPQPICSGGPAQFLGPHFAQVGLHHVLQARQRGFDLVDVFGFRYLDPRRQFHVGGLVHVVVKVGNHFGNVEITWRHRLWRLRLTFSSCLSMPSRCGRMPVNQSPAPANSSTTGAAIRISLPLPAFFAGFSSVSSVSGGGGELMPARVTDKS